MIGGPIWGLIGGLISGPILGLLLGLLGLIGGLNSWLISGLTNRSNIILVEVIQFPASTEQWRETLPRLREQLIFGLISGLIWGLMLGLIVGLIDGLILGLILGLMLGMVIGLIWVLRADVEIRSQPNQGIRNSARNMVILCGISLAASFILYVLLPFVLNPPTNLKTIPIIAGIFLIWMSLLVGGGLACIQHFALRCVLFRSGVSPWNYARFLDYASERLLIQRVGGRYRFIHKLLQDHFAEMTLSPPKSPTSGGL